MKKWKLLGNLECPSEGQLNCDLLPSLSNSLLKVPIFFFFRQNTYAFSTVFNAQQNRAGDQIPVPMTPPPWPHWRKRFPGFPLNSLPFPFAFLSRFCCVVTRTTSHWRWLPWQRTGSCAFEALQGKQGTEPVFHFVAGSSDTLISQEQLCLRRKYQTLVLFLDSLTRAPWQTFWRSIDHLKNTHGSPFFAFPEPVCECWAICVLRQGKWWSCGWQKGVRNQIMSLWNTDVSSAWLWKGNSGFPPSSHCCWAPEP